MPGFSISELIPVLQVAVGPVILISGVGLLLLTMTNRFGRVIDRSRILVGELREEHIEDHENLQAQIKILACRAYLLRRAILLASVSVLLAAILVIVLFLTALFHFSDAWLVSLLFIGCMLSLIFSLVAFIQDLNQSLVAFNLEVGEGCTREGK